MRIAGSFAAIVLLSCSCHKRPDPLPGFPRLVLWAWERPENLQFLDPNSAGVAFLSRTVSWRAGELHSQPRLQRLQVPPDTPLMAVVRLESSGAPLPEPESVNAEILKSAALPGVRVLQVDFDARLSEREWYRGLIRELRGKLNASVPLTITALASWCDRDSWIADLPVAEAVPMLFRMGAGEPTRTREFRTPICQSSFGVATDELPDALPRGRRLFVFHPRPWDEGSYRGILRFAAKWN
jgi:hypothetical protein